MIKVTPPHDVANVDYGSNGDDGGYLKPPIYEIKLITVPLRPTIYDRVWLRFD